MEGSGVIGGVLVDDSVILYHDDNHAYCDHSSNHDLDASLYPQSLVRKLHHSGLPTAFSYGPSLSLQKLGFLRRIGSLYSMTCFSLEYVACWQEIVNSPWHELVKGGVVLYVLSRTRYEEQTFLQLLPPNFRVVILDTEDAVFRQDPTIVSIRKLDELPLCICRLNQEAIGNNVITVGYTMKPSREEDFAKRGAFPFKPTCNGLMFLPLTFELPLPLQLQHIDVLLHKATDKIVSVDMSEATAVSDRITFTRGMQELKRYMDHDSNLCVIDPLNNIYPVLDRLEIQKILLGLEELKDASNNRIRGPHFLKVNSFNGRDFAQNLSEAKLSLPCIVKPQVSCGVAESHTMAICFDVNDFKNLSVPLPAIIQEYVDHSSNLYKYYVLGDAVFYAVKKSTPNADILKKLFGGSELKPLLFDSLKSLPIDNDCSKSDNVSIDHNLVAAAAKWLSSKLGLTIFGFDVVVQDISGDHVIVDVNFLPSFKEVPNNIAIPAFWDAIKNKYNIIPRERRSEKQFTQAQPKKIIIDTDPGIDDAMAIFLALKSPEVQVIGLTTIYGNVYTTLATRNALHLLEIAGRTDIPVAEGSHVTITNDEKLRIADFVHGTDGLGNQNFPPPNGKPIEQSAAAFLVEQVNLYPGEVTVVALGPLTNIALAIQLDPAFAKKVGQIVVLGGAFLVNGNANPAAEANIYGDPEAADIVFTSGADVLAVGINVTHQVVLSDVDRDVLASSNGKFGQYLNKVLEVYFSYHQKAYATRGVFLHDPTALLAAVDPSLMTYTEGVVRVQTSGITRGLTVLYNKQKRFGEITEWSDKPTVKVAVTVDGPRVLKLVLDRLMES